MLAHVRNIGGDFLRAQLGIAGHAGEFFDMNRGVAVFLDDPLDLKPYLRAGDEAGLASALADLVQQYSTRAIALNDGVLVFDGTPEEIDDERFIHIYGQEAERIG